MMDGATMQDAPVAADLPLADVHATATAPWWPPAPGWWLLAAALLAIVAAAIWWRGRRARRRRDAIALFDASLAAHRDAAARVAAMSELLRRAGRRRDPMADRLQGEAWLRFLDDEALPPRFDGEVGRTLLEGGFRREVPDEALRALESAARERFVAWMLRRPARGAAR